MDQPPDGYQEIGEALAQPVAENLKGFRWGADLAKLAGYTTRDFRKWLAYYREVNADALLKLERKQGRQARKIERWRRQSELLRKRLPPTA